VPPDMVISINPAPLLMRVATNALAGDIAARQKKTDEAVRQLTLAVAEEDSLHYDEPPTWYWPVRHALGAALLTAGRARDAEAVYREDLRRHPDNGWSLLGLTKALRAEGMTNESEQAEIRFKKAWAEADVMLLASVF